MFYYVNMNYCNFLYRLYLFLKIKKCIFFYEFLMYSTLQIIVFLLFYSINFMYLSISITN
jgi:hypothetical protein